MDRLELSPDIYLPLKLSVTEDGLTDEFGPKKKFYSGIET